LLPLLTVVGGDVFGGERGGVVTAAEVTVGAVVAGDAAAGAAPNGCCDTCPPLLGPAAAPVGVDATGRWLPVETAPVAEPAAVALLPSAGWCRTTISTMVGGVVGGSGTGPVDTDVDPGG
jgi:hypothetical protein